MTNDLTELEMRVLGLLEEANEEDAITTLNTIIDPTGTSIELSDYQEALLRLVQAELIEVQLNSIPTGRIHLTTGKAIEEIRKLSDSYEFITGEGHWTDRRESGPPYFQFPLPCLVLTPRGRAVSVNLLESRGYQWWRPV